MIRLTYNYFTKLPPLPAVYIDGVLYVSIAFFQAATAAIGSDEAAKWIGPATLFWLRASSGIMSACVLALKMFRSTTFGEHKELQKKNGDPQMFVKTSDLTIPPDSGKS